jgi:hypothetical protein
MTHGRRTRSPLLRLALFAAALTSLAGAAGATTLVPLSDPVLVDRTSVIVVARVQERLPVVTDRPMTDWLVQVERVLKGDVLSSGMVVRVLGGRSPSGDVLTVFGAPKFRRGERVLLFLEPRADGTWGVAQFLQGAFHEVRAGDRRAAVRDLTEVKVVRNRRGRAPRPMIRDFDGFADWVEDRAAGVARGRDYLFRASQRQISAITAGFTLFVDDTNGLNLRWFQFDSGGAVTWKAHSGGQPGLGSGGFPEFQRGLALWTNESTTPVRLVYGGTTTATAGFSEFDGQNVILFDDFNQDIEGTFDCSEGGTLAIGGPWSSSDNQGTFNGRRYVRIQSADIVMNDGIACSIQSSPNGSEFMEEVYAHELGHTLGLGHSSENENETNSRLREALMFFQAHDDGRGARLNPDDVAGLQALYKKGTTPPPGPGNCPADTLCLLNGRFRVTATWENQFNGASGAAHVPRRNNALPASFYNLSGFLYFDDPNNIELIVKILDFGSENVIKVFYGQLTNLRFTISVTDTRTNQTKTYQNTAGDCGGFDNNGFPSNAFSTIMKPGSPRPRVGRSVRGTCRADADTMCLLNNRFQVEMTWRNQFNNTSGVGIPTRLSDLTGAFAFTDRANLELLVKTLEFPDRFLVLYGALSNLEYTLSIRDTVTGATETYNNPAGRYCGGLDNDAF